MHQAQQTISVYLFAYAVMSLLHGPLSDAIGRRRVIIGGLAVFTLASVGCALAPGMGWLLLFRLVQGLSAGVGMIVGRAVGRDVLDGHDAQRLRRPECEIRQEWGRLGATRVCKWESGLW